MTYVISCPNCGFHFPINPNKHQNQGERYCPKCRTPITIRKRFKFLPNPKWLHQRAEETYQRTRIKEMRRQQPKRPSIRIPTQIPETLLALSVLFRKREIELEEARKNES